MYRLQKLRRFHKKMLSQSLTQKNFRLLPEFRCFLKKKRPAKVRQSR
jgi:hypothetical protein